MGYVRFKKTSLNNVKTSSSMKERTFSLLSPTDELRWKATSKKDTEKSRIHVLHKEAFSK